MVLTMDPALPPPSPRPGPDVSNPGHALLIFSVLGHDVAMDRAQAVLITLIVYKLVLIGIGLATRNRATTKADFFLGGRSLGPWVAAISASASSSSAWTLLGLSGFAYTSGLSAIWFFPSCVGGFLLNWYVVAPAMRRYVARSGALTLTEVLVGDKSRQGARAIGVFASLVIVVLFTVYVASQFKAAGIAFAHSFDGITSTEAVILGAAIVLFYTLLGGFWAVSLTDTLQGMMMALTAVILPLAALAAVGPAHLWSAMEAVPQDHYMSLTAGRGFVSGLGFVVGVFGIGLAYPGQPHVVNRFMALEAGEASLRRARLIAIGWSVVIYAGMILLGWCGRILFGSLSDTEGVLIRSANELLHPVFAGIMVASVLSAIMSTADSQLLVAASALVHDLDLPVARGRPMLASRLVIVAVSLLALAFVLTFDESIFNQVLFAFSAAGAAFGPPLLALCHVFCPAPWRIVVAVVMGLVALVFASLVIGRDPHWKAHKMFFEYTLPIALSAAVVFTARRSKV